MIAGVAPGGGLGQRHPRADDSEPTERSTPDEFKAMLARHYDEGEKQIRALKLELFSR